MQPQSFPVRRRLEEVLLIAAADRVSDVELDVDPALEAFADPDAFDRVVSNLITNAFRYGSRPCAWRRAERRASRPHGRGSGDGVPPQFVPRLFERFSQDQRSAGGVPGSGLGLAIAQSYAQAHGGEIVYSAVDPHGARFELALPDGPRQDPRAASDADQLSGLRGRDDGQARRYVAAAVDLVDHVHRVVLVVRPGHAQENARPTQPAGRPSCASGRRKRRAPGTMSKSTPTCCRTPFT